MHVTYIYKLYIFITYKLTCHH